jgi:general stress protein YciG
MATTKPKGFRYLMLHNPGKLKQIARKGGKAAQAGPNAKCWSKTEAQEQGRKGAEARWARKDTTDTKVTKGAA